MTGVTGFTAPRRTFRLTFERPDLEGLEVRVRSASIGDVIRASTLTDIRVSALMSGEDRAKADELFALFVGHLVEWNVVDDAGDVVPPTVDGVRSLDPHFALDMIGVWAAATSGRQQPAPLDSGSPGGEPSLEESMPMDVLSPSPPS